jgi:hypothetical protein
MERTLKIALVAVALAAVSCHPTWESAEQVTDALGKLATLDPKVTVRRSTDLEWQDGASDLPLFPFDSVRTYPRAKAKILLENGSQLDISEDSLIVLNPSAAGTKGDRATMRNGRVKGRTTGELWIMTSAALLKLKSDPSGKPAEATLSLKEGKQLEVRLDQGQAALVQSRGYAPPTAVSLSAGRAVTVPAPVAKESFGVDIDETRWRNLGASEPAPPAPAAPAADAPPAREAASMPPPAPPPSTQPLRLVITSPANYAEVSDAKVDVRGRVTRKGGEIKINGNSVAIGENLEFTTSVPLNWGANTILVQLIREKGDSVFQRWTVIRKN